MKSQSYFVCAEAESSGSAVLVPQFHQLYQDLINSKDNALTEKSAQQ